VDERSGARFVRHGGPIMPVGPAVRPRSRPWARRARIRPSRSPDRRRGAFAGNQSPVIRIWRQIENGLLFGGLPGAYHRPGVGFGFEMLVLRADPWMPDFGMGFEAHIEEEPTAQASPFVER